MTKRECEQSIERLEGLVEVWAKCVKKYPKNWELHAALDGAQKLLKKNKERLKEMKGNNDN